jgi:hypothetical protein
MLTYTQLVALHRALSNKRVLSVYLDGSASDPAKQRSWRVQLDQSLADLRRWLDDSSHAEREEFEQCVHRLDTALAGFSAGIGAPGWAAFITADRIHDAQRLPAPAPTLAVWSTGPCIAPYMRALKEHRPVIVVLVEARRASMYRYHLGKADGIDVIRAHHSIDQPEHMGTPARQGFHTGTRGRAGRDAAQRGLLRGRDRMIAEAADRVQELAGADGWILIGGIDRVAARLAQRLEPLAPNRVTLAGSLDVHASEADIAQFARSGASELRDAADDRRITEILDLVGAHGLGAVGPTEALLALEQSSVRDLYVTRRYVEDHAAEAEQAIRTALDQDASVEEVSGRAAERLNQHGGMAAGLRFRASLIEDAAASSIG